MRCHEEQGDGEKKTDLSVDLGSPGRLVAVSLSGANAGVGVARVLVLLVSLLGSGELLVRGREWRRGEGRDTERMNETPSASTNRL